MGILQSITSLFLKAEQAQERGAPIDYFRGPSINNPAYSLSDVLDYETSTWRGSDYVSPMEAMALPTVQACVKIIAEDASTLDINVERRTDRYWETDHDHYLNALLQDPHPQYGLNTILEVWLANAALTGNGIMIPRVHERTGRVLELDVRSFQEVNIYHTLQRNKVWYQTIDGQGLMSPVMSHDQVCHLKGFSLDGITGLSPIATARHAVNMGLNATHYANSNYASGGFGGGFIESEDDMDAVSRLKFAQEVKRAQATGLHPVLDRGMKITPNKISPKDIDFVNTMRYGQSEIASIYRVPLSKLSTDARQPGSSLEQSAIAYVTDCIRPWVRRMETELERILLTKEEKQTHRIKFDLTSLMRGDSAAEANYYSQMLASRVMVPNEVRRLKGMKPMPWGDDPIDHQKSANSAPGGPSIHTITKKDTTDEVENQ